MTGYISGNSTGARMTTKPTPKTGSAVVAHRERLRRRGLQRLELQVRREDAALVRAVAAALADPQRATAARTLLRGQFAPAPPRSLKALLAAAPLEGVDLERTRDTGRAIEL
jgi:hypothetical protein